MDTLNYTVLNKAAYNGYVLKDAPEKVMQFGEGNFLRAFVDYWFDISNEKVGWNGKCVIIKPRNSGSPTCDMLNEQQGLFTLHIRGVEHEEKIDAQRVISSVSRCLNPYTLDGYSEMMKLAVSDDLEFIVSNTTEAGIVYDPACCLEDMPCASFPGKLAQVLYARYKAGKKGLIILPCELNDNNGIMLRDCVLAYATQWGLDAEFKNYICDECLFCNTLVDRIVPGGIRDEREMERLNAADGYRDSLRVTCETFGVWNIEGPQWLEDILPFKKAGANCVVVPDIVPYKKRKVRILNGAHTSTVLGAYLAGYDIVRECMYDDVIHKFLGKMLYQEVIPTIPLDKAELLSFSEAVAERFRNPYIDHYLLSISLNSTSKWRARILPTLLDTIAAGSLPQCLAMSFAMYIAFYTTDIQALTAEGLVCRRPKGDTYVCSDERWVLDFYYNHRQMSDTELVHAVMSNEKMWGTDLTKIPEFERTTINNLKLIREKGAMAGFANCL